MRLHFNAPSLALLSTLLTSLVLSSCGASTPPPPNGSMAPAFMLQNQDGRVRTLAEYGGRAVVLYFYPRDATPGCTTEACAFRDVWAQFESANAVVLGVSTDDVASHRAFQQEHRLPFDLLADTDGTVARAYGVPVNPLGMAARMTFVIGPDGRMARAFRDVDPGVHADQVLEVLRGL